MIALVRGVTRFTFAPLQFRQLYLSLSVLLLHLLILNHFALESNYAQPLKGREKIPKEFTYPRKFLPDANVTWVRVSLKAIRGPALKRSHWTYVEGVKPTNLDDFGIEVA